MNTHNLTVDPKALEELVSLLADYTILHEQFPSIVNFLDDVRVAGKTVRLVEVPE